MNSINNSFYDILKNSDMQNYKNQNRFMGLAHGVLEFLSICRV
jgi:hypothetical protein